MKRKSKYGVLAAALLSATCLCGPSFAASTAVSGSNAAAGSIATGGSANNAGIGNSTSSSLAGSASNSTSQGGQATGQGTSTATINFNDPGIPATTTQNVGGTERVITTGAAIAPSIYSNNVCALSASAAGGFLGGAFALGFDRVDHGCDLRAWVALLGHFAEINRVTANSAADPVVRARAEQAAIAYAQWANNYICMQNPDIAAAAPPGAHFCETVATQQGMQVVPAPVPIAATPPPRPILAQPVPPPKPQQIANGPHVYGTYEAVPSSHHTGPISGYDGPDYQDD